MSIFRKQLKENHNLMKNFDYSKGDTSLKFTLRVDMDNQLRDFRELLIKAVDDINDELEELGKRTN